MTKQQRRDYKQYLWICEQFGEQPQLLEAHFELSEQQKRDYKLYCKECLASGVEPARADFLLELQKPQAAMGAAAGR